MESNDQSDLNKTADLKKTVNLPQTPFPMQAKLAQNEPKLLERWSRENIYERLRQQGAGRPRYVLHDGPPYANGAIHLGHALNKLLKDFIVKSKTMSGYDSPYIPGWDCHGLPIEIKVDGQLGGKKAQMSTAEIRGECRKYAQKYVDLQSKDFQRLGIFGRWDDPYLTMSPEYESVIAKAFVDFLAKDYIYKGLKPVNWCINDRTALAEAEVEYENHTSPSIWVRFALTSDPEKIDPALAGKKVFGLIWTTTPWTIPANLAICYHPKFEYVAVEAGAAGDVYLVAKDLLSAVAAKAGWGEDPPVLAAFAGERLEGTAFRHPFLERDSIGILGDHVTLEQGTGAVHTAPGHGHEDYVVGQKYGLSAFCPVDGAGRMYQAEGAPGVLPEVLIGKKVWDANPVVIELLTEAGALLATEKVVHSYPHCWRCHKPTIFRATEQWFIGMEKNGLRERTLEAIRKVEWHPGWGEERISNMIASRPDWCISRQRVWGVPIVVFYCEKCNTPFTEPKVLNRVVDIFKEKSSDAWYSMSTEDLMGPGVSCSKCGGTEFRKESDILDVWFDSGASHLAVLTKANDLGWPANMYLEGGDQHRGWFHSSLLIGVGLCGSAPYREVATNGWTLDGEGRAMSKSLGNGIEPQDIIKANGAETIRLWVSSVAFHEDVRLSDTILERITEAYRKLRNTLRFILGNTSDFDPAQHAVAPSEMHEIDQWALVRAEDLITRCRTSYDEYAFHKVYRAISDFCAVDLSSIYFDVIKDRLYTSPAGSKARRSAQTAVWRIGNAVLRLLAPILAFTTEEAWAFFAKPHEAPDSIHLTMFPEPGEVTQGLRPEARARVANWDRLLTIRDEVMKKLEEARGEKTIGSALQASISLEADADLYPLLVQYKDELPALFIVSQVAVVNGAREGVRVTVDRTTGTKCERCWKYTFDVGTVTRFPTCCKACGEAVTDWMDRQS